LTKIFTTLQLTARPVHHDDNYYLRISEAVHEPSFIQAQLRAAVLVLDGV
jgi:hypothetical protein